jgi:two-component system, sensor histidine kinase and response regulator
MKKVLVIDDEAAVANVVGATLRFLGYSSILAFDGESGVNLARQEAPDLIICDVNMPDKDGYETLKAIQQNETTATTPFIFLSGMADRPDVRRGMELGADDYLAKPFTPEELMAAVRARLTKKAEQDRRTEKRLDEVRGNITLALPHELRTPLTGILGLSTVLIDDYASIRPEDLLDTAQCIHRSAIRLQRLIENFLIYAQLEFLHDDKDRLRLKAAASATQTQPIVTAVARQAARDALRGNDLRCETVPCVAPVIEENLKKIVEELASNAFKFSEPGSPVFVRTQAAGDTFTLTVTDHGRGMTPEQIACIGPHIQFDRRIYEQQGMGLGLIIPRRLTELQGGQWSLESEPGRQTTVRVSFTLPAGGNGSGPVA